MVEIGEKGKWREKMEGERNKEPERCVKGCH